MESTLPQEDEMESPIEGSSEPDPSPVFRTALDRDPFPIRTLAELAMVRLSASIRSKPDWWIKRNDPVIREKWKQEALATELIYLCSESNLFLPNTETDQAETKSIVTLSEQQVEYVLDELEGYERLRDQNSGIEVACFDSIWKSDSLIPHDLRAALLEGVSKLENVPDSKKDWHPNTEDTVLDLVHPSLYLFMYDKTPVYSSGEPLTQKLVTLPPPPGSEDKTSKRFQWLPTDFAIDQDGSTHALGYINNLHSSHKGLYRTIERGLSLFIPLFERVLTDMINELPHRIPDEYGGVKDDPRHPGETPPYQSEEFEVYCTKLDEFWEIWEKDEFLLLPTVPPEGYTGGLEHRKETYSLRGKTVQVIIKLANIHLTPEKPKYDGGSWHVEGMLNERIVATGIYYYDQENITSNELAFRMSVEAPESSNHQADSYDYSAHMETWGLFYNYDEFSLLNQVVGAVETKEHWCIAFPNLFQHRVSPFELEDPAKPGHRKILVFFLVNPSEDPIPSTTIVPPQQPSWAIDALLEHAKTRKSYLSKLPLEILDLVATHVKGVSEEEAKALRLEFMAERSKFVDMANKLIYERQFNLCEH